MSDQSTEFRMTYYMALAALAGSIVALHSMEWKKMSWGEIAFTLVCGFFVAIYAVPYVAEHWLGLNMISVKEVCGITFIGGTAWNILIPLAVRKIKQLIGVGEQAS